jgi:Rieske 2Fe-2S family protein
VPTYGKALISLADDPGWIPEDDSDDGSSRVARGMSTWSFDGQSNLPVFEGLSADERSAGMRFASFTGSMFIAAHPDYVRGVRLLPRSADSVELIIDWLLLPQVRDSHPDELRAGTEFGRLVVEQDGRICELNQRGLRSQRHQSGVLVPQEEGVWAFHEWLRKRLGNHPCQVSRKPGA